MVHMDRALARSAGGPHALTSKSRVMMVWGGIGWVRDKERGELGVS